MTTFKSPIILVSRSAEYFFNKIENLNNLKNIMPSTIKDFESTENTCSFKGKGMPHLNLEIAEKSPFSKVSLISKNSQIPFSLDCIITSKGEQCQARLEINIELNMMMKIMVEKPLTQFLDAFSSKIASI